MKTQQFPRLAYCLSIGLLFFVTACGSQTRSLVNDSVGAPSSEGSETQSSENATQIVALTSLAADIIHTLDDQKLVGISGSSLLAKDQRFSELEQVSQGRTEPDLEKIVSLKPDLVIGAEGFHDKTLSQLKEINIRIMSVNVDNWDSLMSLTQDLAKKIGADPQPLADRYEACLANAQETAPSALVLVSRQPLLSPNQKSWAGDFLERFNLQNLTAELQGDSPIEGYITLSEEKVLTLNPEKLFVIETGREELLPQLQQDAFWGELEATKSEQVHTFDYYGLVNPGSLASIEATCSKLSEIN